MSMKSEHYKIYVALIGTIGQNECFSMEINLLKVFAVTNYINICIG